MSEATRGGRLAFRSADPFVVRRLTALAVDLGFDVADPEGPLPPDVVVVDLDRPDAGEEVARCRARWPESLVAGHLGVPDRSRWLEAERAGCDLVASRGGIAAALRKKLASSPTPGRRRVPLFAAGDVAGRLGLVHRRADSPVGAMAVYHLRGRLHAVCDVCPHAGATLSDGELEGTVITCPRHGSQFEVRDGSRLRGPADAGLPTFPLLEEAGHIYLLL